MIASSLAVLVLLCCLGAGRTAAVGAAAPGAAEGGLAAEEVEVASVEGGASAVGSASSALSSGGAVSTLLFEAPFFSLALPGRLVLRWLSRGVVGLLLLCEERGVFLGPATSGSAGVFCGIGVDGGSAVGSRKRGTTSEPGGLCFLV